jgi:hypothetical protein
MAILSWAFHLWWKKFSTTITFFNNYFLEIREAQVISALVGHGGLFFIV